MPDPGAVALTALAVALVGGKCGTYILFIRAFVPRESRAGSHFIRSALVRSVAGLVVVCIIFAVRMSFTRSILTIEGIMLPVRPILWWLTLRATDVSMSGRRLWVGAGLGTCLSYAYDAGVFLVGMAGFAIFMWKDL
jgi:hypothetical protein